MPDGDWPISDTMKMLQAYLDGWRVLCRVLAFALCLGLFATPSVLAAIVFMRMDGGVTAAWLLGIALLISVPIATYLASWYSGEFRNTATSEESEEEFAGVDEEW